MKQFNKFFLSLLFVISCQSDSLRSIEVQNFKQAALSGDLDRMEMAVDKLVKNGAIKKGMSSDELEQLLGKASGSTGIYQGYSIGYSNKPVEVDYGNHYWFHFNEQGLNQWWRN